METLDQMKTLLCEKYLPSNYFDKLRDQAYILVYGNMSITEYTQKFEKLKTHNQLVEDDSQAVSRFKAWLRVDIKKS